MTHLETVVANVIADTMDVYQENFSDVMVDDIVFETELSVKSVKGALGSLIKKDFVFADDVNGEYNVYYLTADGFKALKGNVPDYM